MDTVTANELKTKGVSSEEAYLRKHELEIALLQAKADIDAGRYSTGSIADHIKQVSGKL